jgi:hypothetical protein
MMRIHARVYDLSMVLGFPVGTAIYVGYRLLLRWLSR